MKTFLIAFSVLISLSSFAHKYYMSVADLEYDAESNAINGSLKATAHDFEALLESHFNERIHIENVADSSEIGTYMKSYLSSTFKIFSNNKELEMNYLGKEVTLRDNLYFYFTFSAPENPKEIEVENSFLCDRFTAQQNIVHYKYQNLTKSVTLLASKTKETIKFDK